MEDRGEGSVNLSSDVDGIGGEVPNRENGLKSEDETDGVGEAQKGSKEEVGQLVGNIDECQPKRFMGRLRTGSCWWTMGKLGKGRRFEQRCRGRVRGKGETNLSD